MIEDLAAVRRMTKMAKHPQPRVWMLNYPLFFRAALYPWSYPTNISHFGILCGVGWYPTIEALARDVESELRALWREQFHRPDQIAALEYALATGRATFPVLPYCTDISQVDGELKVEFQYGSMCPADVAERIRTYVDNAVASSRYICESCGRSGKFRESYWRRVYCDDCLVPEAPLEQALEPA
ncbi:hypothetical protein M3A49_00955 [Paraburkholderia sp. CNPSo 3076]|uniref:hypothetical protein n=1 Tax=Paraburkholderia sp. CNPSo 3076 TaxID=2940936 RepID=UPI002250C59A|nr:hypothetical protein [Paraburkholderia sp. CNPSo 3076]MCX5538080.1 hypothetical protein [Paraburkholderia sp. CNPSo 3076]